MRTWEENYALGTLEMLEEVMARLCDLPQGQAWLEARGATWAVGWESVEPDIADWLNQRNTGLWEEGGDEDWWTRLEALRATTASLAESEPGTLMAICAWLDDLGDDLAGPVARRLSELDARVRSERFWLGEAWDVLGLEEI